MRDSLKGIFDSICEKLSSKDVSVCGDVLIDFMNITNTLKMEFDLELPEKEEIRGLLHPFIGDDYRIGILIHSFLIDLFCDKESYTDFAEYQLNHMKEVPLATRAFVMVQSDSHSYRYPNVKSEESDYMRWTLHNDIVGEYAKLFSDLMKPINDSEANDDLVFVLTDQYLHPLHGPTKFANDKIVSLVRDYKKRVLLINTAEVFCKNGAVHYYNCKRANYVDEYLQMNEVLLDGFHIPFFQCENNMPEVDTIRMLLQVVQLQKPGLVITFGGNKITSNLLALVTNSVVIPLTSDLAYSTTRFQANAVNISDSNRRLLQKMGKDDNYLIRMRPSYMTYKEGKAHKRDEFGIGEDTFLGVTVSGRFDSDLTDEFWEMIGNVENQRFELLLIGKIDMQKLDRVYEKYPNLKERIHSIGNVNGVLEYYDMCDLYINPERIGGGTSAFEALYKGVPVLTKSKGDIAEVVCTDEFCVDSYDEMTAEINHYMENREYYEYMVTKSTLRSKVLNDPRIPVWDILNGVQKRYT